MIKGTCIIGQSGGPTAVINASLAGAIKAAQENPNIDKVLGARHGLSGILEENFIDFTNTTDEDLDLLKITPGAYLGSVRFFMPTYEENKTPVYDNLLKIFKKYNVRYFFYTGGNDSMDTCHKIAMYLKSVDYEAYVIGIPKTIDNDLVITDHSPGYGSAIKFIATTVSQIYLDTNSYQEGRVTIVEAMGRDAGWLTAGASLARLNNCPPDLIYLPEVPFNVDEFLNDVKEIYNIKQKVLVVVGEGIKTSDGEYLLRYRHFNNADSFGHLQLGGVALVLCEIVSEKLSLPVRSIELNLPERSSAHILSKSDCEEAYLCGKKAIELATKDITDKMVIMERNENNLITYASANLKDVATAIKPVPLHYINERRNNITDEFITYAKPLIQGELMIPFENGLPKVLKLK